MVFEFFICYREKQETMTPHFAVNEDSRAKLFCG